MKKINLRDYYPYYTQDMIVEVPDEVADILREYKLAEAAYFLRTYRHKAYFSLDYDINVEHEAMLSMLCLVRLKYLKNLWTPWTTSLPDTVQWKRMQKHWHRIMC